MTASAAVPAPVGRLWLPVLLCLTLLAYVNGLAGPLQFDDHALETDRAARDLAVWWDSLGRRVRPLLKASYILSHSLGELVEASRWAIISSASPSTCWPWRSRTGWRET